MVTNIRAQAALVAKGVYFIPNFQSSYARLSEPKKINKKKRTIGRGATDKNVQINRAVLILRGCIKIELQN
jgi:hypothetical protein